MLTRHQTGGIASLSTFAVPGLLVGSVPARELARQWQTVYNRGKATMPFVAIASLAGFAYVAYQQRSQGQPAWTRYGLAGALTIGIVPFTIIAMTATNNSLMQVASGATALGEDATRSLLLKWKGLNMARSMLPLAGAVVGLWTFVVGEY